MNRTHLFVGAMALACSMAGVTSAQSLAGATDTQSNFARDRNISVMQRPRPGYDAIGLRVGGFLAWPKLTSTVEHNDNIYAASTAKSDDTVFHIAPELRLASTWSRHMLGLYARGALHRYSDFKSENTEDWSVGGDGRIDIRRSTSVSLGAGAQRLTEPRTSGSSPVSSANPIEYDLDNFYVSGSHELNRLRLAARYDWRRFNYKDGRTGAGAVIDQDDRDRQSRAIQGRAEYAVSPDTAVFIQATANKRDYRVTPALPAIRRDSKGVELLAGANFDVGALMRGEVGLGYMKQNYEDPALQTVDGFGARARVEWFPTQLMTVTLTGSRTIEESGIVGTSGYIATAFAAHLDYEVLRNLILGAEATYGKDAYNGRNLIANRAYDRDDKRTGAGLSATYLLNRNVGITVGYNYTKQKSTGLDGDFNYKVNKIGAKLTLQY